MVESYGRVAALQPANTNEAELYAPGTGVVFVGVLRICNQDTVSRTYEISHTDTSGAATAEDFIVYDKSISANDVHEISITMKNPETIRVKSSVANKISFVLEGMTRT